VEADPRSSNPFDDSSTLGDCVKGGSRHSHHGDNDQDSAD
jgi:hypothetical protein